MVLKGGRNNNFQKNVLMTSASLLHKENLSLEGDGLFLQKETRPSGPNLLNSAP